MDVGVGVAHAEHVGQVGANNRSHHAAQPKPRDDGRFARNTDQIEATDSHELNGNNFLDKGVYPVRQACGHHNAFGGLCRCRRPCQPVHGAG
ncbi:Uncharacterised protein [Mycobacterium tuberculosis]|uniref:Uncharacterized protein n=1 Tax=Mycobacterium tuberculosis TaxID=1773 RepID=A0A0U0RVE9_MYCTX|nr:hypothetical protein CAB90_00768 [Mycobacterium tuberculosis]COW31867.1 Uncharacterised protein [Mycobacterium tuberculosis]